jgi:hypothetical protein
MNQRQHALLAKQLVDKVGGVKTAAHITELGKTAIYRACDPNDSYALTMPRVVALENYAGTALYSKACAAALTTAPVDLDLTHESMDLNVFAATLSRNTHAALADGRLSNRERDQLSVQLHQVVQTAHAMLAEIGADRPADAAAGTVTSIGATPRTPRKRAD